MAHAQQVTTPQTIGLEQSSGNTNGGAIELDTIAVESARPGEGYKADDASSKKFTAPLLETPKSVTVITEELIEERGQQSLVDVLRTTPGITLGSGEGGNPIGDRPFIRGADSMSNTFVDGVRDTGSQSREVFNLEQVEIVKGPNSAYTGRGSGGGSINLVTKTPQAENFAEGSITFGTDMTKRFTGDANYMISDSAALRLNLLAHDAEVAGRDEVEEQRFGIAPSLALGLGGPTRAIVSYYHFQSDDVPDYGHPYDPRTGRPADVDRSNFYGLLDRDFRKTQVDSGTVRLEHDFNPNLTLSNTTRYSWSENDYVVTNPDDSRGNVVNGEVLRQTKTRNSDTTALINHTDLTGEFTTGVVKHSFATGIELSREESRNRGYTVTGTSIADLYNPNPNDPWNGTVEPSTSPSEVRTVTKSAYVFDTIDLTSQWSLNLGLRYDDYETECKTSGVRNDASFWNYQVGVVYKPVPFGSIYASFGTSSSPSGTDAGEGAESLGTGNESLEPVEYKSYELGTKWDLLDRRLSATAAIFRTETTNARVATAPGRGAPQDVIGEETVDGFELGPSGSITDKWQVWGGYTFLDSEIVDDGAINSNEGNQFPNTPRHSFSIWTSYDIQPDISVGGGAFYMSRRFGDAGNTKEVPSYWRFDATASYEITPNFDLRLNVLNIFDETYYDKPYTTHFATVAPGRSALLTATAKF